MTVYTSRFGFQWNYAPHDVGWGTDYNFTHRALSTLLHAYLLSDALNTPPGSPAENDAYLVATGGTGAWSGQSGNIAAYQGGAWQFYTVLPGVRAYFVNRTDFRWWNGALWVAETALASGYVQTVAGHSPDVGGNVALVVGDIGGAAPLASPAFTGNPTATTQAAGNNSIRLATTQYVDRAVTTAITGSGGVTESAIAALDFSTLPTSDPGGGKLWLNGGVLQVGA